MKTLIAKCDYYQLLVDEEKQRLYVHLSGYWNNEMIFSDYLKDIKIAASIFDGPFDCHSDFFYLKAFTDIKFLKYHHQALQVLKIFGLRNGGQVMPEDHIACQQLLQIIRSVGKAAVFGESELVDTYLDAYLSTAA